MKRFLSLRSIKVPDWTIPLILLLVLAACFVPFLPLHGFYWADWAKTLVHRLWGSGGYWDYYAGDRPLSGWTHIALLPLLGESPVNWQLFSLGMRWVSTVGMWWVLSLLWPKAKTEALFAALLFAVYPVFTQQPIAVTFHQQWMQFALYFLSLGCMLLALRKPQHVMPLTILSIFTMLTHLSITEYFLGLEILRPLIIWFIVREHRLTRQSTWRKFFKSYLPYLVFLLAYILWRFFLMELPQADPYATVLFQDLLHSPIPALIQSMKMVIVDLLAVLVKAWSPVLDLRTTQPLSSFTLASWVLGLLAAISLSFYLYVYSINTSQDERASWFKQALLLGIFATLLGILPGWAIGRQVVDDFHSNRYAMPAMFGASLLFVTLLKWFIPRKMPQAILLGVLLGMSIIFHLQTGKIYRNIWSQQLDLYWQFHWRAPHIEIPTAILFENEPIPDQGLFSISSAFNFIYPQPGNPELLGYYVYSLRPRYDNQIPDLSQINFNTTFRSLSYQGSPPDTLLIYYNRGMANCMWVLSNEDQNDPYLSYLQANLLPLSNLERIQPTVKDSAYPPQEIFGPQPEGTWCSYYQQADLASQFSDWARVVELGDSARESGYSPDTLPIQSPHEWIPFIKGSAHAGRWEEANQITLLAAKVRYREYDARFCELWEELQSDTDASPQKDQAVQFVTSELKCNTFLP
jgi:hypothetical protein